MPWYALQTHTTFEERVAARLALDGVEHYWPSRQVKIKHARRQETVLRALFPGYLFASLADGHRLYAPHLIRVVGFGDHPVEIPDSEINSVRIMAASPAAEPCAFFTAGQPVYIRRGPLAGVYGVITRVKGVDRVVVSCNLIAQSVSAEVDADWLELRKAA
jgi:transcription antitermination factor NusG